MVKHPFYNNVGAVNLKMKHSSLSAERAVKGARGAFISTLDRSLRATPSKRERSETQFS